MDPTGLLTGNHIYTRFNPMAGLTYKLMLNLSAYAGYSEANRAPTTAELGCADPTQPCLMQNFLVSDPHLKQVVSKTWRGGFRGNSARSAMAASIRLLVCFTLKASTTF